MFDGLTRKQRHYILGHREKTVKELASHLKISEDSVKKVLSNKNYQNISPLKKILFYFILFLLPFIIFLAAEIFFRAAGVGNDYPLVKQQSIYSLKRNIINRDIAKRYFSIEGTNKVIFDSLPIISCLATIFGMSIVVDCIHQHEINKIVS